MAMAIRGVIPSNLKHSVFVCVALLTICHLCLAAPSSELVLLKVDRRIDLTSHIVRVVTSLKVENTGLGTTSEVLLAFPPDQVENLAYLKAAALEGKGKNKVSIPLIVSPSQSEDAPGGIVFYFQSLW